MLAILEVLEGRGSREVIMRLLQIINLVSTNGGLVFDFDFPDGYARAMLPADCSARLVACHGRRKLFGGLLPHWVCSILSISSRPSDEADLSYGSGIPVMMGA
jgi:hypothetical protein